MKKQLIKLKEDREAAKKQLAAIVALANKENRELTPEEAKEFDDLEAQVEDLNPRIERAEKAAKYQEEQAKKHAPEDKPTPEQKLKKAFSMSKAIAARVEGAPLEGAEKEMHDEAKSEAMAAGLTDFSSKGVALPSWAVKAVTPGEKKDLLRKDLTVGSATSAGNLVADEALRFIPALLPTPQIVALGADVWTGMRGPIPITRETNYDVASWAGETDTAPEKTMTTSKETMTPKRLTAKSTISRQLILQTNGQADRIVNRRLENAITLAVDLAAINGSGASNQPLGLLNDGDVNVIFSGAAADNTVNANGIAMVRKDLVNAEKEIAVENALMGNLAWLTNPKVRAFARDFKVDAGSGKFLWPDGSKELLGYPAAVSTQVPSDLVKGASGSTLSALLFGDWSQLILANWGGIDIIIDEYTQAADAEVRLIVHSWWDINTRHPQAFTVCKDIVA